MRLLRRLGAGLFVVIVAYLGAAVIGALIPGSIDPDDQPRTEQIVLVPGPIHYDFLIPLTESTRAAFAFLADDGLPVSHPDAKWLVAGWGSKAFYTATGRYTDLKLETIWTAATGDTSVLRFQVLGQIELDEAWPQIELSDRQLARLRGAILQEFRRDADGSPSVLQGAQLTGDDAFFEAKGHFWIFRTCNVWVGEVLRHAGVPMGRWTPTPYAVTLSHWWFN